MIKDRPKSATHKAHGTYTKYFQDEYSAKQTKCKLGVIHPIPRAEARTKDPGTVENFQVAASAITITPVFKEKKLQKRPVPQELAKPFMYVQKVVPKRKPEETAMKHEDVWSYNTSIDTTRKPKYLKAAAPKPPTNQSLYDIEERKRKIAKQIFQRLYLIDPDCSIKNHFLLWAKNSKYKTNQDLDIDQGTFSSLLKDFTGGRIKQALIHDFFICFKNQPTEQPTNIFSRGSQSISFKAFCYNYQTFLKTKKQVNRILSEKAAQERYINMKMYVDHWHNHYPTIKQTMKHMREYENRLRGRFLFVRDSYKNPFVQDIKQLKQQLQQPMIKYDKPRKEGIENKIKEYEQQHERTQKRVLEEYEVFSSVFQDSIVHNHNLFFKKKTLMKLLKPLFDATNHITKEVLEGQVGLSQQYYQRYLEVLSKFTMDFSADKKILREESFSFAQLAKFLAKSTVSRQDLQFIRKLVKRMKIQHCLYKGLQIQNLQAFPGDQQITIELLNKCYEIQCTRILFKNQVWQQLLQNIIIPGKSYESKYHASTINMNITMEAIRRLLENVDYQMALELNRSREVCNLVDNLHYDEFQTFADVIRKIDLKGPPEYESDDVVQPPTNALKKFATQIHGIVNKEDSEAKKVKFADMIFTSMDKLKQKMEEEKAEKEANKDKKDQNKDQESAMKMLQDMNLIDSILMQKDEQTEKMAKNISKLVLARANSLEEPEKIDRTPQKDMSNSAEDFNMMKTLAKSQFINDPLNVNALDVRFYEESVTKMKEEKKRSTMRQSTPQGIMKKSTMQPDNLESGIIGQSILLSNLPKIEQLPEDPLRISKFLLRTLDAIDEEQSKKVQEKKPQRTIREGVNHNYYKQRVEFENKPAVYDCEGATKYSLLLPVNYYSNAIIQEKEDREKWYLRPHHVETLTENPLSKKDNIVSTQYKSAMERLPGKKREDELIIEQNVRRKDMIIQELEDRVAKLKANLQYARRSTSYKGGARVPTTIVDTFFNKITEGKADKQLQVGASESILYDLRKQERDMLVGVRGEQLAQKGYPQNRWWHLKDKTFNEEYIRHRNIVQDERKPPEERKHIRHIQRLANQQLY